MITKDKPLTSLIDADGRSAANRWSTIVSIVLVFVAINSLMMLPSPALARDMTGKGGVGILARLHGDQSIKPSLAIRYWREKIAIDLLAGIDWQLEQKTSEPALGFFQIGLGVHRRVFDSRFVSATVGLRAWGHYGWTKTRLIDTMIECNRLTFKSKVDNRLQLVAEFPFQVEFFLSDHASIVGSVGFSVGWHSAYSEVTDTESQTDLTEFLSRRAHKSGFRVELGGNYSGGIGYTYYF